MVIYSIICLSSGSLIKILWNKCVLTTYNVEKATKPQTKSSMKQGLQQGLYIPETWTLVVSDASRKHKTSLTFRSHRFPTLLSSEGGGFSSSASTAPLTTSFNPRSLARWSKQMKQKLVLISSIFSLVYVLCRPDMTDVKVRASVGSVGGRSSVSCLVCH